MQRNGTLEATDLMEKNPPGSRGTIGSLLLATQSTLTQPVFIPFAILFPAQVNLQPPISHNDGTLPGKWE